jgi:hypothetical protein
MLKRGIERDLLSKVYENSGATKGKACMDRDPTA